MGIAGSTGRRIDEATSNSSLSNLRYIAMEKPKWKVFGKREIRAVPMYQTSLKPKKGCPCGNSGPCKQKVTPKGVTIHYPQKKKKFAAFGRDGRYKPPKIDKGYLSSSQRVLNKVKIVRPRKFPIPTWRVDKVVHNSPFQNTSSTPSVPSNSILPEKCDSV